MIIITRSKIIKKYDVISFDVFDTLIKRETKNPSDVFLLVGNKVLGPDKGKIFKEDRIKAELNARKLNECFECNLENVYDMLPSVYDNYKEELKNEEIRIEIQACHPKKKMVGFLNECLNNNKRVVIISDMYLSSAIIAKMLKRCGINNYEKLYVSNEYNTNKICGGLFQKAIKDLDIERKTMIHIGDSYTADVKGARKVGIDSKLVIGKSMINRITSRLRKI